VLAMDRPECIGPVRARMAETGCTAHDAELAILGASHAEVGGYLLGIWGLPYPVIEAVANHHQPSRVGVDAFGTLAATHIADAIVHENERPTGTAPAVSRLDAGFVARIGVADRMDAWRALARQLASPDSEA
jgi:HD-like signal output (HDOD) protein